MAKRSGEKKHFQPGDLHGLSKLAIDATIGMTDLVESMHKNISRVPGILGTTSEDPTSGVTGLVYRSIRGVTRLVGSGLDLALGQMVMMVKQQPPSAAREAMVAAVNGVLGDHLVASGNPMAISMRLRRAGQPLKLTKKALSGAIAPASSRILLLVHGLCMSDLQWQRNGHDHGSKLAADPVFAVPFTTVYLHYNSGLHISINGRELDSQLEALLKCWPVPVEELTIVAHSMGGLVTRSACDFGAQRGHRWPRVLKKIVFLGTPHCGAPLERGGNWLNVVLDASPYTSALARLAKIRSAGITDLRHAGVQDADWQQQDRFTSSNNKKMPGPPLPAGVDCYAIAASIASKSAPFAVRVIGDGLVPLPSALGQRADPEGNLAFAKSRQWIGYGLNHMALLDSKVVYRRIRKWLAETP